ncbi:hypothetical protein B0H12DRAFT_1324934 [Mycena haematopus]|nr:hypothetical protein B0H12DRAFT_1324934 [Mycena haematopus]
MAAVKPQKLVDLEEDPLYKDFLKFYVNRDPAATALFADISLPVFKVVLVSSGHLNGHWFFCFYHDDKGESKTYVNCKAVLMNVYSQLWIGSLTRTDTEDNSYELPVTAPHRPLSDFIHVLLHPTASDADGVYADKPMLWYRALPGPSSVRVLAGTAAEVNGKIAAEGDKIEKENKENPKGKFFAQRPDKKDYELPVIKPERLRSEVAIVAARSIVPASSILSGAFVVCVQRHPPLPTRSVLKLPSGGLETSLSPSLTDLDASGRVLTTSSPHPTPSLAARLAHAVSARIARRKLMRTQT